MEDVWLSMSVPVTSSQTMPMGAWKGKVLYLPMFLTGVSPPKINSITYLSIIGSYRIFNGHGVSELTVFAIYPSPFFRRKI